MRLIQTADWSRAGYLTAYNRKYSVQGEVEQIAMMKPKAQTPHETGLLEYLEDIIGTDKYVEQIEAGSKQWVISLTNLVITESSLPLNATHRNWDSGRMPPLGDMHYTV